MRGFFILFLIFTSIAGHAQKVYPAKLGAFWGYINAQGTWAIPAQYDQCLAFENRDYTWVQFQGKSLLINKDGKILRQLALQQIVKISWDYIIYRQGEYLGVIDQDGNAITEPKYLDINYTVEMDRFQVLNEAGWGLMDTNGSILYPCSLSDLLPLRGLFIAKTDGRIGVLNQNGQLILPITSNDLSLNGDFLFTSDSSGSNHIYTRQGDLLWSGTALSTQVHSNHYLAIQDSSKTKLFDARSAQFVDSGQLTYIELSANYLQYLNKEGLSGLFRVSDNRRILPDSFQMLLPYVYSQAILAQKNGLTGLVDSNGTLICPLAYTQIGQLEADSVFKVFNKNKMGLYSLKGKSLLEPLYDYLNVDDQRIVKTKDSKGVCLFEYDRDHRITDSIRFNNVQTIKMGGVIEMNISNAADQDQRRSQLSAFWFQDSSNRWGLKDTAGNLILRPIFNRVTKVKGSPYALCQRTALKNVMRTRSFRISANSFYALVNEESFRVVGELNNYHIDTANITDTSVQVIRFYSSSTYAYLIHKSTEKVLRYNSKYIGPFHNGVARIFVGSKLLLDSRQYRHFQSILKVNEYAGTYGFGIRRTAQASAENQFRIMGRGYWAYINAEGKYVRSLKYFKELKIKKAGHFKHKRAIVALSSGYGVIDTNIDFQLPPIHDSISPLQFSNDSLFVVHSSHAKHGYISASGRAITPIKFNVAHPFSDGLSWATEEQYSVLINKMGSEVVRYPRTSRLAAFNEGVGAIAKHRRYRLIDSSGNDLTPPKYSKVGRMNNDRMMVRSRGYVGYVNADGQLQIPAIYSKGFDFVQGLTIVKEGLRNSRVDDRRKVRNPSYGIINVNGEFVVKPKYSRIWKADPLGYYKTKKVRYGLVSPLGKKLLPNRYKKILTSAHLLVGVKTTKLVLYNEQGKRIKKIRARAKHLKNGYLVIRKGRFYGIIDSTGAWVLAAKYSTMGPVQEGLITVKRKNRVHILNLEGDTLFTVAGTPIGGYSNGLLLIKKSNNSYVYYNRYGVNAFNKRFVRAKPMNSGLAVVAEKHDQYGVLDQLGFYRIKPQFTRISDPSEGVFRVTQTTHIGVINEQGKFLISPNCSSIEYQPEDQLFIYLYQNQPGYFSRDGTLIYQAEGSSNDTVQQ